MRWFVLGLAACSSGPALDPEVAVFVGRSTYQAGSQSVLNCSDDAFDRTDELTGTFQLAPGERSDLIEVVPPGSACRGVELDVESGVANALAGQTCTSMAAGLTTMSTLVKFTIALDGDTLTLSGNFNVMLTGTASAVCTTTVTAMAVKGS